MEAIKKYIYEFIFGDDEGIDDHKSKPFQWSDLPPLIDKIFQNHFPLQIQELFKYIDTITEKSIQLSENINFARQVLTNQNQSNKLLKLFNRIELLLLDMNILVLNPKYRKYINTLKESKTTVINLKTNEGNVDLLSLAIAHNTSMNGYRIVPDVDIIQDIIKELRIHVKAIEEYMPSKAITNIKHKSINVLLQSLRQNIPIISDTLQSMEIFMPQYNDLFVYITHLRTILHKPIQLLQDKVKVIEYLGNVSNEIKAEYAAYLDSNKEYELARNTNILRDVVTIQHELLEIEKSVDSLVKDMRAGIKIMSSLGGVNEIKDFLKIKFGNFHVIFLVDRLLNCETYDLLRQCLDKHVLESLVSSITELKGMIESSSVSLDPKIQSIMSFDSELFAAYILDWDPRVKRIAAYMQSSEFKKSYKKLAKCRDERLKRYNRYKMKVDVMNNHIHFITEASNLVWELKCTIPMICLKEFDIITPISWPDIEALTPEVVLSSNNIDKLENSNAIDS